MLHCHLHPHPRPNLLLFNHHMIWECTTWFRTWPSFNLGIRTCMLHTHTYKPYTQAHARLLYTDELHIGHLLFGKYESLPMFLLVSAFNPFCWLFTKFDKCVTIKQQLVFLTSLSFPIAYCFSFCWVHWSNYSVFVSVMVLI